MSIISGAAQTNIATANGAPLANSVAGVLPVGGLDQSGQPRQIPMVSTSYQNSPAILVEDVKQHEGDTLTQILSNILLELQILNHQIHQLPLLLNKGVQNQPDEPATLRNEQSLFNQ